MKTKQILIFLQVCAYIVFVGLCIKTGALLISFIVSVALNSEASQNLYMGLNLSNLLEYSQIHYTVMASLIIILSGLKAYLFYLVIKITSKINIAQPFSENIAKLISKMSGIALEIGILAFITHNYAKWLLKNPVKFSYEGGEIEYLFLAAILYVIAIIFKRGIELQSENELTI
jgi:magnesium-transporting ATPase (P-type)